MVDWCKTCNVAVKCGHYQDISLCRWSVAECIIGHQSPMPTTNWRLMRNCSDQNMVVFAESSLIIIHKRKKNLKPALLVIRSFRLYTLHVASEKKEWAFENVFHLIQRPHFVDFWPSHLDWVASLTIPMAYFATTNYLKVKRKVSLRMVCWRKSWWLIE